MRTAGVICEYNPFHTGHAWQLRELRRRGAEAVVCCMSGNFVQRGDLAVVRKHARAEAAVRGGADLVLELPLARAISSAEGFAGGGVEVLEATGVVDTLAFGSECADTETLRRVARCLLSDEFPAALKQELSAGDGFAAARARSVKTLIGADAGALGNPNDILGVEYCKALLEGKSRMEPLALPRVGAAHDAQSPGVYASASCLRELLLRGESAEGYLTPEMAALLEAEHAAGRAPVSMAAAERAILSRLRTMREDDFAAYDEGGEGLYHRFFDAVRRSPDVEQLLDAAKSKRYAYARLRRMLLAAYLGVTSEDRAEHPAYIRVLAMNDKGKYLLREMREKAALPIVVKPAETKKITGAVAKQFEREARATDLYALAYPELAQSAPGSEWTTNPVIVEE